MYGTKTSYLVIVIMCLVILACMSLGCEEPRGNITGRVLDENGEAVAGAIIRAGRIGYPYALLRTDENGYYSINEALPGKWNIEFYDEHGFAIGLEEVTVKGDNTSTLDFNIGDNPPPSNMPRLINVPQLID